MDLERGAVWAYRLVLNREPESAYAVSALAQGAGDAATLALRCLQSDEFSSILERAGTPFHGHDEPDLREAAVWAFRFFAGRDALDDEPLGLPAGIRSLNDVRLCVLLGASCDIASDVFLPLVNFSIVNAFAPFPERIPVPDGFVDFLGSRTKTSYIGGGWESAAGYVYRSVPRAGEAGLHGTSEWVGTLRSVLEAGESLAVAELGAGWGPWLVAAKSAASLRGIERFQAIGIEASAEHYEFMHDNLLSNGIDPKDHKLIRGVVAEEDGIALFPKLNFFDDYGANAVFADDDQSAASQRGELEQVRAVSIDTLMQGIERIDLVHIDIQGHELAVVTSGLETLNAKVRRMVIGTHSRAIDGGLLDLLQNAGWLCESFVPCELLRGPDLKLVPGCDGEQVWRNPRIQSLNALFPT